MTDVATDELTAEEEAILRSDTTPPQSAEEEVVTTPKEGEQTEDPPKTAETEKKDGETETKPEGEGQKTEAEADPDADFKAFSEKHKDKSAEEILKLAFQQGKARTAARSCPITAAAAMPRPMTSPMTRPTRPRVSGTRSYQSPPTSAPAAPGR